MAFAKFPDDASDWRLLKNGLLTILNHLLDHQDVAVYDPQWVAKHDPKRLGVEHAAIPIGTKGQAKLFADTLTAIAKKEGIPLETNNGVPTFEYRQMDRNEAAQVRAMQSEGVIPSHIVPEATALINGYPKLLPVIEQLREAVFRAKEQDFKGPGTISLN